MQIKYPHNRMHYYHHGERPHKHTHTHNVLGLNFHGMSESHAYEYDFEWNSKPYVSISLMAFGPSGQE